MSQIEAWYRNPETGVAFGFSLPLHAVIADQVARGYLVPCPEPGTEDETSPPPPQKAAEDGDGDLEPGDDPALHICEDCGAPVVRKGGRGPWPAKCDKHKAKG